MSKHLSSGWFQLHSAGRALLTTENYKINVSIEHYSFNLGGVDKTVCNKKLCYKTVDHHERSLQRKIAGLIAGDLDIRFTDDESKSA